MLVASRDICVIDERAGTFCPTSDLPTSDPWGGEKGWRLDQSPAPSDLINRVCVMKKPP